MGCSAIEEEEEDTQLRSKSQLTSLTDLMTVDDLL
jgi:hypothetical protein